LGKAASLLLFACACFGAGFLVGRDADTVNSPGEGKAGPSPCGPRAVRQVIAYYFHPTVRREACTRMETRAEDVIRKEFPAHVALEEIVWRTANLDEPWNRDFVERYGLESSALVLVSTFDGRELGHRVLDRLPLLVDDEEAFTEYVRTQLIAVLEEESP
jgi:hypothetical protein